MKKILIWDSQSLYVTQRKMRKNMWHIVDNTPCSKKLKFLSDLCLRWMWVRKSVYLGFTQSLWSQTLKTQDWIHFYRKKVKVKLYFTRDQTVSHQVQMTFFLRFYQSIETCRKRWKPFPNSHYAVPSERTTCTLGWKDGINLFTNHSMLIYKLSTVPVSLSVYRNSVKIHIVL